MPPDLTPDSFIIHSGDDILYADPLVPSLIGVPSRAKIVGKTVTDLIAPEFHEPFQSQIERLETREAPALGLALELETHGRQRREAIAVSSLVDWEGTDRVQTSFLPLTDQAASSGTTMRDSAMEEAPIGITISDPAHADNPLIYVNDGFLDITGYDREEVLGRNCRFLQGPATRDDPVAKMRDAIDREEPVTVELRNYRKDGWRACRIVSTALLADQ